MSNVVGRAPESVAVGDSSLYPAGADTEVDIDVETSQSAVLEQALEEEVRVEELQTSPTSLTAVSPSDETSLLVGPYWVGLAVVMCGVSYAAMVYSKTWSGV